MGEIFCGYNTRSWLASTKEVNWYFWLMNCHNNYLRFRGGGCLQLQRQKLVSFYKVSKLIFLAHELSQQLTVCYFRFRWVNTIHYYVEENYIHDNLFLILTSTFSYHLGNYSCVHASNWFTHLQPTNMTNEWSKWQFCSYCVVVACTPYSVLSWMSSWHVYYYRISLHYDMRGLPPYCKDTSSCTTSQILISAY